MSALEQALEAAWREHSPQGPRLVFGEGPEHPLIALVGEAPGGEEEKLGRPFVGKAGKNLDEFLALAGLDRAGIYITNAVKFRPTRISAKGTVSNRTPTGAEIEWFRPWLAEELLLRAPRVVATLGNTPLRALLGRGCPTIGACHGRFLAWQGRLLYPMYHPASLIYNPGLREIYREDAIRLGKWEKDINI